MKKIIACFLLVIIFTKGFGQHDTTFFDKFWKPSKRSSAAYYRIVNPEGPGFLITDYYISNIPQMRAYSSKADTIIKNGKCTFYDRQGRVISEGMYANDVEAGPQLFNSYFNTGSTYSSGFLKNCLLDSTLTYYYRPGTVYITCHYKNDLLHGLKTVFRDDGSISTTENYVYGKLEGWYTEYRKSGLKYYEEEYRNGKSTGNKKLYFESGRLQGDFNWTERKVNGSKTWYYENGDVQSKVIFENGKRIKVTRAGNPVQ